jgi:Mycothiol maleylpyruvate isomerase N-terminal domain
MNLHAELTDAAGAGAGVVANVTPGQFADPTPDTDWDVRTLLNHLILCGTGFRRQLPRAT